MKTQYDLKRTDSIETPALLYYPDIIKANTRKAIELSGGADRMWPHMKTHKMPAMIRMQLDMGITRFKCATIAEAEMTASCGAGDVLLSYPLVGPSIGRLLRLGALFEAVRFWAIADDLGQLRELGRQAVAMGVRQRVLVDVDLGMRRTGIPPERLEEFYRAGSELPGVDLLGIHAYDGHIHHPDPVARRAEVEKCSAPVHEIRAAISRRDARFETAVMGSTATFACHASVPGVYLSPGTLFVHDHGYRSMLADLPCVPGAALLTRVISRPTPETFTLDLGYKAISPDPAGARGVVVSLPGAEPVEQTEEHWVFRLPAGCAAPAVGDAQYVVPTHICPTTALHAAAWAVRDGVVAERWEVAARNRKITV